jgi:recombination associated protein RdgC
MFKNLFLYRVIKGPHSLATLNDHAFQPCGATQEKSMGWVPPRADGGELMETIGGQKIVKLLTETKAVPGQALKREVERMCADIEKSTGRKPGKKERREIKEDALLNMLPGAFPKQAATLIWIDPINDLLAIDASSQSKADEAITMLVKSFEGLELRYVNTTTSPAAAMAMMLVTKEAPDNFTIDRECELKATDESKAVVKYGRHPLDIEEVAQHIRMGKMPTKLAMTYSDRVSFVLTEGMQLKKIELLDVAFEGQSNEDVDHFDADVAITTGELSKLIPDLIAVLGGEVEAA